MPSVRAIRYFLAVAETGGFSRAADALKVAQPSVTSQVQALEGELGVPLLIRHHRGASLTEAGKFFRDRSIGIVRQIEALATETRARADHPAGTLVVGMTPSLRSAVVVPALREFCDAFPHVRVRAIEDSPVALREMAANNQVDAVVVPAIEKLTGLHATPLLSDPFCLIGTAEAGLEMTRPIRIQELRALPLIIARHPNSFRRMLDALATTAGIELDIRIEADTLPLSIELVGAGGAYTPAAQCVARDVIRDGKFSAAPIEGVVIDWVLASLPDQPRSAAMLQFVAMLEARCAVVSSQMDLADPGEAQLTC